MGIGIGNGFDEDCMFVGNFVNSNGSFYSFFGYIGFTDKSFCCVYGSNRVFYSFCCDFGNFDFDIFLGDFFFGYELENMIWNEI